MLTDTYIHIHIILVLAETPVSLRPPGFLWTARLSFSIVARFAEAATNYSDYSMLPTYFPFCGTETINGIFTMHIVLYKVLVMFQVVLVLLEEREMPSANKLHRNMMDIPFSDGYISLGVESVPFLADRTISVICFPCHHASHLLTVHNNTVFVSIIKDGHVSMEQCYPGHYIIFKSLSTVLYIMHVSICALVSYIIKGIIIL